MKTVAKTSHPSTEQEWWDAYGDVQERVWVYDEYFEKSVRSGYLNEMSEFLFKPGGRVLDFGCGSGWIGLRLAERGMQLEGVDISGEQIKRARQYARDKGVTNAHFSQTGGEIGTQSGPYDSIIVHSLFHHLYREDKQRLLNSIAAKLVDGGRAYFYEPLAAKPGTDVVGRILNKGVLGILWLQRKLVYWLHLQENDVRNAIKAGWTMQSPAEAPIDLEEFIADLPPELGVVKVTCWHMAAIAYANLCMGLKPFWRELAKPLIILFHGLDRIILSPRYRSYMRAWPMASIMVTKVEPPGKHSAH